MRHTGLAALETMVRDKSIDKPWSIKISALPDGVNTDAIDDAFLLPNYAYDS